MPKIYTEQGQLSHTQALVSKFISPEIQAEPENHKKDFKQASSLLFIVTYTSKISL